MRLIEYTPFENNGHRLPVVDDLEILEYPPKIGMPRTLTVPAEDSRPNGAAFSAVDIK